MATPGRLLLSVLATALAAVVLTAAPAFAAAPEAPEASVADTTAVVATPSTEAILRGVLDPNIAHGTASEVLLYEFVYRESPSACKGAGEVKTVPQGMSVGMGREEPSQQITGLKPGTVYSVCLLAHNSSNPSEETPSAPVTFETPIKPETPVTEAPAEVMGNTATLRGELNPASTATNGYHFAYNTNGECTGASTSPAGTEEEATKRKVSTAVTGLEPLREYTVCVVSTNAAGEETLGNAVNFSTPGAPPIIESESASNIKATEVTLEGVVNPNNEPTECHFQYGTASVTENERPCTPELLKGFGGQGVSSTRTNERGETVESITGLTRDTAYHYRLVVQNGAGKEVKESEFTTALAPETPEGKQPTEVTGTSADLAGLLNPAGKGEPGTYEFLYKQSSSECELSTAEREQALKELIEHDFNEFEVKIKQKVTPSPAGASPSGTPQLVSAHVENLLPGTEYTVCLVAHNDAEPQERAVAAPVTFITSAVGVENSPTVTATEATLTAELGPGGQETTYELQYGTSSVEEHTTPQPEATLAASSVPVTVEETLKGLRPGGRYEYRFVAHNERGEARGEERTFTTPAEGTAPPQHCENEQRRAEQPYGLALPECRAYELVSPTNTNGSDATIEVPGRHETWSSRASVSGDALTYLAVGDAYGNPGGGQEKIRELASRSPTGWAVHSINPPFLALHAAVGSGDPFEELAFTPELTKGFATTDLPLTPEAPSGSWQSYLADFASGSYERVSLTNGPGEYRLQEDEAEQAWVRGTSTDMSHIVYAPTGEGSVEEWTAGKVFPVALTNEGQPLVAGAGDGVYQAFGNLLHAVSSDASHVYFTAPVGGEAPGNGSNLYLRVNPGAPPSPLDEHGNCTDAADACTLVVSASQRLNGKGEPAPDPHGPREPRFRGASSDGSKAFFLSAAELTTGANTGPEDNTQALYEYDAATGRLTDLSPDTSDPNGSAVQGVVQISEDGGYVYFVAEGDLASGASAGQPNLYVSHDGVPPAFIATLAPGDNADWNIESPVGQVASDAVSPAGSLLAFLSTRELTGYDNRDAATGEPDSELLLYDAETGHLACASCNPSGARPLGGSRLGLAGHRGTDEYRPRTFAADGRLFFDSEDALVPNDTNRRQDVYEYFEGRARPLSDVTGNSSSTFLDASASGADVFIATADQLLPQAPSNRNAVYDVRVGGGFAPPAAPPPCDNADSCKPPPSAQPTLFSAPASETFSGPGNLAPLPTPAHTKSVAQIRREALAKALKLCRKDKRHNKRTTCERRARAKFASTRGRRSSHGQKGNR